MLTTEVAILDLRAVLARSSMAEAWSGTAVEGGLGGNGLVLFHVDLTSGIVALERDGARQCVRLEATRPVLGGVRWWGRCPACCRRIAVLYRHPANQRYVCRTCHGLAYETASSTRVVRAGLRAQRLRRGLQDDPRLDGTIPRRPTRMAASRYRDLAVALAASEAEFEDQMELLRMRAGRSMEAAVRYALMCERFGWYGPRSSQCVAREARRWPSRPAQAVTKPRR